MDVSRFRSQHDRFIFLDLTAQFEFKTQTSISFLIGDGPSFYFKVQGRVEVHHPCEAEWESAAKVQMRVSLPSRYLTEENMMEIIKLLYSALGIPEEATHQVRFFEAGPKAFVVQDWCPVAYASAL